MHGLKLQLEKSKITWSDQTLIKYDSSDNRVAEFSAKDIQELSIGSKIDYKAIIYVLTGMVIMFTLFCILDNNTCKFAMSGLVGIMSLFIATTIKVSTLHIKTCESIITMELQDPSDFYLAFVHSVQLKLKETDA